MSVKTWTIFGTGYFINDINDAVESNEQRIEVLVLNMVLNADIMKRIPAHIKVINIADFKPSTDFYIFGFLNPDKQPFIELLRGYDLHFHNLVHQRSYVAGSVDMGKGNFIGAGAVIAPNVKIGDFNYINRNASVGHDTVINNFNHIGPGCNIAGLCRIGNNNYFGIGSTIIDTIEIKDSITIGAGGVVVDNISDIGSYVGVPVKKIK
jgi:sugar O-acyltransferase (sialic acid O-acetyltransferase NeuD family)